MGDTMISKLQYAIAFFVLMFTLTGCASMMPSNRDKVLGPANTLRFSDIPYRPALSSSLSSHILSKMRGIRVALSEIQRQRYA